MLRLKTILLPTDFSSGAKQALDHALFLAQHDEASLHLLHAVVLPAVSIPMGREAFSEQATEEAEDKLNDLLARRETDEIQVQTAIESGEAVAPIIQAYADEHDADLIVMGTHGRRGIRRFFMGSVTEEVVRGATRPVLAVHERDEPFPKHPLQRILVPLDFSQHSEQALGYAQQLAVRYQAALLLLHVMEAFPPPGLYGLEYEPVPDLNREIEMRAEEGIRAAARTVEQEGLTVDYHIGSGHPASYIIDVARDEAVGLIVLASHGRTGLDRVLMGSVAEQVMRQAPCPIFVVKSRVPTIR